MPKACIRLATSLPTRPSPMIAKVLPKTSFPTNDFLSHAPLFKELLAGIMLRLKFKMEAHVNSQALITFPIGELKIHKSMTNKSIEKLIIL